MAAREVSHGCGARVWPLLTLSLVCTACGEDATHTSNGALRAPVYSAPACPTPEEAPLRAAGGDHACVRVGAGEPVAGGAWPDASGAVGPVVYVRPGGTGAGTEADPAGDLQAALRATPAPGTVLLGRGRYPLAAPLALARPIALRGMGPTETVLAGPAGEAVVRVRGEGSEPLAVSLRGLSLLRGEGATAGLGALTVEGARTTCALEEVSVSGGGEGVRADRGATVCASRLSVRGAGSYGVVLLGGALGFFREALVRDGGGVGVLVDRSHLTLERSLVASQGRDGVALRGALLGARCASDADCVVPAPCPGFAFEQACVASLGYTPRDGGPVVPSERRCRSVDALSDVAILGNRVTGLRASRTTPTSAETAAGDRNAVLSWPGPRLRGTRLVIAGTRALEGVPGGDGLYLGAGALASLDDEASSDDDRGRWSELVANARAGILADGDRAGSVPDGLRQAARFVVGGARIASNLGPGVFIQERALGDRLAFTDVTDNAALGLGVTSGGGLALMLCNRFLGTRPGELTPENPAVRPFTVADGASFAATSSAASRLRLVDNEFSANARFGLVLDGVDATLDDGPQGGNRGTGNGYGLGLYGASRVDGTTPRGAIQGLTATAPATAPTVRESVASASASAP